MKLRRWRLHSTRQGEQNTITWLFSTIFISHSFLLIICFFFCGARPFVSVSQRLGYCSGLTVVQVPIVTYWPYFGALMCTSPPWYFSKKKQKNLIVSSSTERDDERDVSSFLPTFRYSYSAGQSFRWLRDARWEQTTKWTNEENEGPS